MSKSKVIPFPNQMWHEAMQTGGAHWSRGGEAGKWRWERFKRVLGTRKWAIIFTGIGFLLGKAFILDGLFPFAAAFFAVIYFTRREFAPWVGTAILAGSLFTPQPTTLMIGMELLLIVLMQRGMKAYERTEMNYAPFMVFTANLLVQSFVTIVVSHLTWYTFLMDITDAILGFVLTLVFIQALPVLTMNKRNYTLRTEELICLIILLASVMTGAVGWSIQDMQLDHMLSRYFVLLFAFVGGATLGASVGVILGLILSLAEPGSLMQMSVLAFAGLLGGMMREGKRWAVAFGVLLGTAIFSVYLGPPSLVMASTWETIIAVVFFLLTPKGILGTLAKYVPGTAEHNQSQHEYAKRVRDMTAERVHQFSDVFRQLSHSFDQATGPNKNGEIDVGLRHVRPERSDRSGRSEVQGRAEHADDEADAFIQAVAGRACSPCPRVKTCWSGKMIQTMSYMNSMRSVIKDDPSFNERQIPRKWKDACGRTTHMLAIMREEHERIRQEQYWRQQLQDNRRFVSEQLAGMSQVMEDLAQEIQRENREIFVQQEQIQGAIDELGLSVYRVDVFSLDPGRVEIEMMHAFTDGYDECRKLIAPLLSDILGEHIAVKEDKMSGKDGQGTVTFVSAKAFDVETGIASAAKGGDLLSGDSHQALELGGGKYAVALSDGMGNGERARDESSTALTVLSMLLQSGMNEQVAIKSANSVLNIRSPDEMYATVDMAIVDLYTANTTFIKGGSTPSFIKSGKEVRLIRGNSLPIGILQDVDIDLISTPLKSGDIVIMMTDGVFDAPGLAANKEMWLKRIIGDLQTDDPQQIADTLLDTVIRHTGGQIEDDMSVVVTRILRHQPQWTTLHWNGRGKSVGKARDQLDRPLTVSWTLIDR
ncbi:SpoIIE family protein phosphatase [Paenibacillus sp. 481]|uniref:SpoIIE family protein phosphatase n=1 Tax=Paenibacillus sp. 481 TaxID=2835869 RepID=UPI001E3C329C|nr:SpoIIE family protein phosphatase [Paenibacillus sp. 481]UHA75317.1 SpoIIE family protein phosphatase [Paenibacillus sp. 481]